jgi:uncharacterized membrane protein YbhN (UPF0104 family)
MRRRFNNILFIVGIAAVVVMVLAFDVSLKDLWQCLTRAGWWLLAIIALWMVVYSMNALSWRTIIKGSGDCPVSFLRLLQLTLTGYALNSATSIGLVSGEPYRVVQLASRIGTQRATSSVVLFVMMHTYSHFWFWLTAIATYVVLWLTGSVPMPQAVAWVLALATVFSGAGIWLFLIGYRKGLVVWVFALLSHIPGLRGWSRRFVDKHADSLRRIDSEIAQLRGQRRRNFLTSLGLEYGARLLQSGEIAIILVIFQATTGGVFATFLQGFLILAFTSLFANLLGFIPMQLGGREGGFALSVAGLGLTPAIGVAVGILCRARELFFDIVGMILMKIKD